MLPYPYGLLLSRLESAFLHGSTSSGTVSTETKSIHHAADSFCDSLGHTHLHLVFGTAVSMTNSTSMPFYFSSCAIQHSSL